MSRLATGRRLAFSALVEAEESGRYVRDILSAHDGAEDPRDRAFALRLALGATATRGCLDELLDCFLAKPKKVSKRVRMALRIAAFEMLYLGTDGRVAVSQGVELVRAVAKSAAGLANAVLRRVDEHAQAYLSAEFVAVDDACPRELASVARRAGIPVWLAAKLAGSVGISDGGVLAPNTDAAPVWLHSFSGEFADASSPFTGCVGPVDVSDAVCSRMLAADGAVVSDAAAQLVACAATRPGTCLEIGAGRGTKTYMMLSHAQHAGLKREHTALELSEGKCALNRERLHAAGLSARVVAGDGCDLAGSFAAADIAADVRFDTVFVDAPCSGTGTMRRHPEIPWRLDRADVERALPELQLAMLNEAASVVAPAGELIYATCSVLAQEDKDVVQAFLATKTGQDFCLAPVSESYLLQRPEYADAQRFAVANELSDGCLKTVPRLQSDCDGHFCARFVRCA